MLSSIIKIAAAAGDCILGHYRGARLTAATKPDLTPLTAADLEAEKIILAGLRKIDASIPCISEESVIPDYAARRTWRRFWLVDPLDGTKEFLKRLGDFTVNIALIETGGPILGVVYAPAIKTFYYAQKGAGAWKRVGTQQPRRLCSRPAARGRALTVVESRSHPSAELEGFLSRVKVKKRVQVGSSLKFCLVAEGKADIYPRFGATMEWDTAAGDCVYRNSGRAGPRWSPLAYNKPTLENGDFVIGVEDSTS